MNLWRMRRWESRRARRGAGWLMLLSVLALCLITLSRGGRAQPPPLQGKTVGDLLQRVAAAPRTDPASSASSASPASSTSPAHQPHPLTIAFDERGISVFDHSKPGVKASPDTRSDVTPAVAATPSETATPPSTPAVAASPQSPPPPAETATPQPQATSTPRAEASHPWNPEEGGGNSSAFIGKLQQMVIMLFLIGFLAFACLKAMGKYLPGLAAPGKRVKQLEVLERQALAQGATVSLVRVGKRYLVVGQTEQNVNTLCELSSDQLTEQPEAAPEKPAPAVASMSFHGDILRHYLSIFPGFGPGRKGDA